MKIRCLMSAAALACCTGLAASAWAQPANDACTDAGLFPITEGVPFEGNLTGATNDGPTRTSGCANGSSNLTVWHTFTPTTSGVYTISLCGSAQRDTILAIEDAANDCSGTANYIQCNDDACGLGSEITPTLSAGTTYRIRVSSFNSSITNGGGYTLIAIPQGLTPPAGDDCGSPITAFDGINAGTLVGATNSFNANSCGGTADLNDVYFVYTAAVAGSHRFSLCTGDFDGVISLHTACPVPPSTTNQIASACATSADAAITGCANRGASLTRTMAIGETVIIRIAGASDQTTTSSIGAPFVGFGAFELNVIAPPPPPANDVCSGAETVGVGIPAATGTNAFATSNPGESWSCQASAGKGVWYDFTAPAAGSYQIDTNGSSQSDTVLAIFDACGGTSLTCDDDAGTGNLSQLIIELAENQNIKILIGSFGSSPTGGGYNLNISAVVSGACCNNSTGACTVVTPSNCPSGSTYQGDNSVCDPSPCPDVGACCSNTGVCTIRSAGGCTGSSVFLGAGTTCTPNPCPQPGACCVNGCCTVTLPAACTGTFVGEGTACGAGVCGAPANDECVNAAVATVGANLGSNCGANTSLVITPESQCGTVVGSGGARDVWFAFTPAASALYTLDTCATPGFDTVLAAYDACPADGTVPPITCNDDTTGLCSVSSLRSRILDLPMQAGVTYLVRVAAWGGGTAEGPFVLNITQGTAIGACCDGSSCSITTLANCAGVYQGDSTACSPDPCAPSDGACCSGTTCSVTSEAACTGANTSFAGAGTVCNASGNTTSPCCLADFNQNGSLSVQDIFDFLAAYFSASPQADINGGGTSVQDIFDFLAAYFGGCV